MDCAWGRAVGKKLPLKNIGIKENFYCSLLNNLFCLSVFTFTKWVYIERGITKEQRRHSLCEKTGMLLQAVEQHDTSKQKGKQTANAK